MTKTTQKIPDGWSIKKLEEVCFLIAGNAFNSDDFSEKGIPLIRISDIAENGIVISESTAFLPVSFLRENERFLIKFNDLLISMSGATTGKMGINSFSEPMLLNQRVCIIRAKFILQTYLNQYLFTQKKDILKQSYGGAQPNIGNGDIKKLSILLPPQAEQEKIAEILGAWDSAIEKLTALIAAKRLQKKGMMQKLLTARIRLPGFTGEWQKVKLGDFLKFQTGFPFDSQFFNQDSAGIRLVKNRDLKSDDQVYFYSGKYADTDIVENGDILVGMDGDFLPCLWKKGTALLNQRVGKIVCKKTLNHTFAYYILFSPLEKIQNETASTTVKHLSHSGVEKIKTTIPIDISEQKAIADILSKADEEIDLLTRKLDLIQSQKKGLMQQLLTGKIRVKVV